MQEEVATRGRLITQQRVAFAAMEARMAGWQQIDGFDVAASHWISLHGVDVTGCHWISLDGADG